ncbi:phosphohydrolase [Spirochaetia bacterium]|nr:phosphohydrolase [Spirochaetia bacterium]
MLSKSIKIIFCLLCSILIISCVTQNASETYNWSVSDTFNIHDYTKLVKRTGSDFRILQLADTQLENNAAKIERTFNIISDAVSDTNPDMLVLTGDNVSGFSNYALGKRLIAFLDTFEIPYALVMGNHDGEGIFNNKKMGGIYGAGTYSLFTNGPKNLPGSGNYGINIVNESGDILYALIMIDSNRYRGRGYDYIYPEQIAWYEWYIKGVSTERYGTYNAAAHVLQSLSFFHIPLPEMNDVRAEMRAANPAAEQDAFRENPCPPDINTGMFQKMKDLNSTTYMVNGHDHINRLDYEYQGIHFVYGLKTGTCSYYDEDRLGATLITIKDDLSIQVDFIAARR